MRDKFLHRKGRNHKKWKIKNKNTKQLYGQELPYKESIRQKHKNYRYFFHWKDGVDFSPLGCYLKENINKNWNNIYSEIIKKTKPKYRYHLDSYLKFKVNTVVYVDYLPYFWYFSKSDKLSTNVLFIDYKNILRFYSTEEELYDIAIKASRRDKLIRLGEIAKENELFENKLLESNVS